MATDTAWSLSRVEWQRSWREGTLTLRLWDNQRWETREQHREWQGVHLWGGPVSDEHVVEAPLLFSRAPAPIAVVPLQLREQTSYRVEVLWSGEGPPPALDCFPSLSPPILRPDPGWRRPHVFSGTLNFRDYVGETALVLREHGVVIFRTVLEVRSRKLGYLDDYVALLDHLGERLVALLLRLDSPVFASFVAEPAADDRLGDEMFLLLRHLVRWPLLREAWLRLPHSFPQQLTRVERLVPVGQRPPRSSYELVKGYQRETSWIQAPSAWKLPASTHQRVPRVYPHKALGLTWDSPEHLFVLRLAARVQRGLSTLQRRYQEAGRWTLAHEVQQLLLEWQELVKQTPGVSPQRWHMGEQVGQEETSIPRRTLASHSLYRPFLEAWDLLSASLRLSWDGLAEAIAGPLRDLARLYEYWCFFALWDALCDVAQPHNTMPPWWRTDGARLVGELQRGEGFLFRYEHLTLRLFYQRRFTPGAERLRSYSVSLVPDYTLEVQQDTSSPVLLCFDAKYRPDQALEKMHAYRDALRGAVGCYLFYPGEESAPTLFPRQAEALLPGVGAFALRPRNESRAWLRRFLRWALEQLADPSSSVWND